MFRLTTNPTITMSQQIEKLSEEIHKLYCAQYLKDHGEPYVTGGNYSILDERMKEYDRNIARFVLERVAQAESRVREELREKVSELKVDMPDHECDNILCPHYPRTEAANEILDRVLALLKNDI